MGSVTPSFEAYPALASLKKDIYRPLPRSASVIPELAQSEYQELLEASLLSLSQALEGQDGPKAKSCFFSDQAFWRDVLAFTYHLRTFEGGAVIAPAMLELTQQRGLVDGFHLIPQSVMKVAATSSLHWVQGMFSFRTKEPAARCGGTIMLLPEEGDNGQVWKIWSLATWIDEFESHPEDESILRAPGRNLAELEEIRTDVFIIGGGNAGIIQAARLKALGVESVVLDRNAQPGDNWGQRYDCLKFHIQKSVCQTPYLHYPDEAPAILQKPMLSEHMKRYAETFNLNLLNSSSVVASSFNESKGTWHFKVQTPWGEKTVVSKQLVQATGSVASTPYLPKIPGQYDGISIHSAEYKNPQVLTQKGVKSVIIVGSGNTAFDITEDCVNAGLKVTMVARSPTYIFPRDYCFDPNGMGLYDILPADLVDNIFASCAVNIGGQVSRDQYAELAAKEPNRYKALAEAGFPVFDSTQGGDVIASLLEKGGGHYNEIGEGTSFIASGVVGVKALVQPTEFIPTGLRFSDGSTLDADAVIWCTGFDDSGRDLTLNVLGGAPFTKSNDEGDKFQGPADITAMRDEIWGLDIEGEIRGMWKRHLRVKNYWITGGGANHHRYYSKPLALQIKAALEGFMPDAYRDVPKAI